MSVRRTDLERDLAGGQSGVRRAALLSVTACSSLQIWSAGSVRSIRQLLSRRWKRVHGILLASTIRSFQRETSGMSSAAWVSPCLRGEHINVGAYRRVDACTRCASHRTGGRRVARIGVPNVAAAYSHAECRALDLYCRPIGYRAVAGPLVADGPGDKELGENRAPGADHAG